MAFIFDADTIRPLEIDTKTPERCIAIADRLAQRSAALFTAGELIWLSSLGDHPRSMRDAATLGALEALEARVIERDARTP